MSWDHYNEICSHQIETLVIFKRNTCNKIKYRDSSVRNRLYYNNSSFKTSLVVESTIQHINETRAGRIVKLMTFGRTQGSHSTKILTKILRQFLR
jgi:hypothetical protein